LIFRSDDLDSAGELYIDDELRRLVVDVEATPASLGGFGELEYHGERRLVRETSLGTHRAVADLALRRGPDDDEQALGFVLQASLSRLLQRTCSSDQASLFAKAATRYLR
jgi:hypothetical protein